MCVVCIERAKGVLTRKEALSALREMIVTAETKKSAEELSHLHEVQDQLRQEIEADGEES